MSLKRGLYLLAGLCLTLTISHAQSADTVAGKLVNFPSRIFSKIQAQSASLSQQVTNHTQQYLARMARREQQMQQKMSSVDSNDAKALFANSKQQYAALAARIKTDTGGAKGTSGGQYQPYVDTLQGAMAFLQQHPQLLEGSGGNTLTGVSTSLSGMTSGLPASNPAAVTSVMGNGTAMSSAAQAKLQAAASQFQVLQAKMQDADMVKAYVQSRQQQISQYIAKHAALAGVLGKSLTGMQQEQAYYTQRLQQYKAMFSNPGAMAQQALAILSSLPAFQNFMKNNSQLGSLFHVPGTYGTAQGVTGLQTKAQIAQIVQKQISAAGPAGAGALQSNLQSAQSQLDGYKDKLSKLGLGGSAGAPTSEFTPNAEKTKTFFHRLQLGFDFQTTHNSYYYPDLLSLGLSIGYKLNSSNVIGVGASYIMGTGNGIRDISITNNGIGLRSFIHIKIKGSFSATGGLEYNYTTPFASYQQLKQLQYWQRSGLIGVTKTITTKSKVLKQTTLSLLWDVLSYQNVPPTAPFVFRVGYNL